MEAFGEEGTGKRSEWEQHNFNLCDHKYSTAACLKFFTEITGCGVIPVPFLLRAIRKRTRHTRQHLFVLGHLRIVAI